MLYQRVTHRHRRREKPVTQRFPTTRLASGVIDWNGMKRGADCLNRRSAVRVRPAPPLAHSEEFPRHAPLAVAPSRLQRGV